MCLQYANVCRIKVKFILEKNVMVWDVTPYSMLQINPHFEETYLNFSQTT